MEDIMIGGGYVTAVLCAMVSIVAFIVGIIIGGQAAFMVAIIAVFAGFFFGLVALLGLIFFG
jgi:hypothetical protein